MGKWAQAGYERTCADKMKTLFYETQTTRPQAYDVELERNFRNFIKTLDTDDIHVRRQFRRLVDAQNRVNAETNRIKDEARGGNIPRRRAGQPRTYGDYAQSSVRDNHIFGRLTPIMADIDPDEQARASTFRLDFPDPDEQEFVSEYEDETERPDGYSGRVTPLTRNVEHSNTYESSFVPDFSAPLPRDTRSTYRSRRFGYGDPYSSAMTTGEDTDDGWTILRRHDGYTEYGNVYPGNPFDLDMDDTHVPSFNRPRTASPRPRDMPRLRSQSPPWSLSHERQRAATEGARPLYAAAEYGPTLPMNAREAALSEAILRGEQAIAQSDNASWISAAREEIEDEATRAGSRRDIYRDGVLRATATAGGASPSIATGTSSGPLGPPLRNSSALHIASRATTEEQNGADLPPFHSANRRQRVHAVDETATSSDADADTSTARNIRRRLTNGDSYRPSEIDGPYPTGVRMQRQRRSMPPSSTGHPFPHQRQGERDRRRDGIVWDLEEEPFEYFA